MKTSIVKRPSLHVIPLIIFTMLILYSASTFANTTQKSAPGYSASSHFMTLAKGQAYVPPQKHRDCKNG